MSVPVGAATNGNSGTNTMYGWFVLGDMIACLYHTGFELAPFRVRRDIAQKSLLPLD